MRTRFLLAAVLLLACGDASRPAVVDEATGVAASALALREEAHVNAPDGGFGNFGQRLALRGATLLVGNDSGASAGLTQGGEVLVYRRSGTSWALTQTLAAAMPHVGARFGWSIVFAGDDTVLIGAPSYREGAVHVFARSGDTWTQTARLVAAEAELSDGFGSAIAVSGERAIVGAKDDDTDGDGAGAAYVLERRAGAWSVIARLAAPDPAPGMAFGDAVAIDGDRIVVGATGDGRVEPRQPGAAYVFRRVGADWVGERLPIDGSVDDAAGSAVAIVGSSVYVGAPAYAHDRNDAPGAVHVFDVASDVAVAKEGLTNPYPTPGDDFGVAISTEGDRVFVGAHAVEATPVSTGRVYVFSPTDPSPVEIVGADARNDIGFGTSVAASPTGVMVGTIDAVDNVVYAFSIFGAPCDANEACNGGACVDGFCCDAPCDGACETCASPGLEGVCAPEAAGVLDAACGAYVCGEAACLTTCTTTADCADGKVCDAEGRCIASSSGPGDDGSGDDGGDGDGCAVGRGNRTGALFSVAAVASLAFARRRRRATRA